MSLNFRDCHAKIRQVDSQSTIDKAVVVQVNYKLFSSVVCLIVIIFMKQDANETLPVCRASVCMLVYESVNWTFQQSTSLLSNCRFPA